MIERTHDQSAFERDRELIRAAEQEAFDQTAVNSNHPQVGPNGEVCSCFCADLLPSYAIRGEIHRDEYCAVFRAFHRPTRRKVAIKVWHKGPFTGSLAVARFEHAVHKISRLSHPNIVTVRDCGSLGDGVYLVTAYISGEPLDVFMAREQYSIEETLRLFCRICEVVNAAHRHGITHGGLKPSNIRVDANGEPRILDFGVAKSVVAGRMHEFAHPAPSSTTRPRAWLAWTSPEQVERPSVDLDIRTDVYSLGVVLYQMLTAHFPYTVAGKTRDVLRAILHQAPSLPSAIRAEIDDEVQTIVLKCLAKGRECRYQSAGALARDLRHYLAGEPIEAKLNDGWYLVVRRLLAPRRSAYRVRSPIGRPRQPVRELPHREAARGS